ncbi:MAG: hypothetical protein PHO66_06265 [Eubacteriales bacterium]|nr:hypothetical protein [Eubacteriales bacterium]
MTMQFDSADIEKNKVVSALAYLGILFFLPLVVCPDSQFGRFHANQGLVLLLANVALTLLNIIPILGQILYIVGSIVCLVFFVMGLVNTLQGKAVPLPVIGKITILK